MYPRLSESKFIELRRRLRPSSRNQAALLAHRRPQNLPAQRGAQSKPKTACPEGRRDLLDQDERVNRVQ